MLVLRIAFKVLKSAGEGFHWGKIPVEMSKAVKEDNLLDLGDVYDDKDADNPNKYDHPTLVLTGGVLDKGPLGIVSPT
ncbi:hypothetical protein [Desulfovulcanus sp.]